jgi:hypothetical protein
MFENTKEITVKIDNSHYIKVKDFKATGDYNLLNNYNILNSEDLDEIITRDVYYGDNAESKTAYVIDFNAVKLYEHEFVLDNLRTIRIPLT